MCSGDDHNCPEFELHRKKLLDDLDSERRSFLKSAFVAGGGAAAWAASGTLASPASAQTRAWPADLPLPSGQRRHGALGLFQQALEASARSGFGRLRHHRGRDAPRRRRRRAYGQGRSGRREHLSVDQGQEGRQSPRRRADGRQAARARRRRRLRRAHLHRSGL